MTLITRLLTGACAALLATVAVAAPLRATEGGGSEGIAADFVAFLDFVGGSPLTALEQQRVATVTSKEMRSDPEGLRKSDAQVRSFLDKMAHDPPDAKADRREAFRLGAELLPDNDPARQIVEAHDPTVVFDRAHKRLVTERSLVELSHAYAWVSKLLGTPGPDGDFISAERTFLRSQFASLPDARQDALTHVERNYPIAVEVIERADKTKIDAWVQESRPIALKLDPQQRSLKLADMLADSYTVAINKELIDGILLGSAENYNMLYHRGYTSGIFR
jgi:hypothetical protein